MKTTTQISKKSLGCQAMCDRVAVAEGVMHEAMMVKSKL
jgi:hypothetical protein